MVESSGGGNVQDPIAPVFGEWEGPQEGDPCVQVLLPADPKRRAFIDLLAGYVAADGEAFEKVPIHSFPILRLFC